MDDKWDEIMTLARAAGFIIAAYGGMTVLITHDRQKELLGDVEYQRIQKMNGVE